MSPEKQRIAIAEACGWVWYRTPKIPSDIRDHRSLFHPAIHEYPEQSEAWKVRANGSERQCNMEYMAREGHVPDYLNDLNAMHEAEAGLTYEQLMEYTRQIALVHMQTGNRNDWSYHNFVHIPANERAEAFLRTIGKWEEDAE